MKTFIRLVALTSLLASFGCVKETANKGSESQASATEQAGAAMAMTSTTPAQTPGIDGIEASAASHECGGGGACCGGGGGSCCGGAAHAQVATEAAPVPANAVWTTLRVGGMRCGNCAKRIQTSLAGVEGVLGVTADHTTGEVKIAAAPDMQDVRGKVAPQIDSLGYKVLDI